MQKKLSKMRSTIFKNRTVIPSTRSGGFFFGVKKIFSRFGRYPGRFFVILPLIKKGRI